MIGGLFKPTKENVVIHHFTIGRQILIVFELINKQHEIIINRIIEKLFINYPNLYFFNNFNEMESELDELITYTNDNYIVVVG